MTIRFDDSLAVLARIIETELGGEVLTNGVALRDTAGRLAFFAADPLTPETIERVSHSLRTQLGAYARDDRVLARREDIGASRVLEEPNGVVVNPDGTGSVY